MHLETSKISCFRLFQNYFTFSPFISYPSLQQHFNLITRSQMSPKGSTVHYTGLHCNHAVWCTWSVKIWGFHQKHEVHLGHSHLWFKRLLCKGWHKNFITTIWDLDCKYLRPTESTIQSSDEDFQLSLKDQMMISSRQHFLTTCWQVRWEHEWPIVWTTWSSHTPQQQLHWKRPKSWCHTSQPEPSDCYSWGYSSLSLNWKDDMFDASPRHLNPKVSAFWTCFLMAQRHTNLLTTVWTFAAALTLSIKDQYGIKASIHGVSNQFDVSEKQLHQAVKGVKYESSSQKWRHKSSAAQVSHDQFKLRRQDSDNLESSSSSSSDDEGAHARRPKKKRKSKTPSWKWSSDAQALNTTIDFIFKWTFSTVDPSIQSPSSPFTPSISLTLPYSKFSIPGSHYIFRFHFKIKSHTNSKLFWIKDVNFLLFQKKSTPFHCQKLNTKHNKSFQRKRNTIIKSKVMPLFYILTGLTLLWNLFSSVNHNQYLPFQL